MHQRRKDTNRLRVPEPFGMLRRKTSSVGTFKSITAGLLLCCVFVDPVIASFTWLYYQKAIIKREVKRQIIAGIDEDDLVLLKFSKEEAKTKLRWEHSKEFEYNRQMYDVVKTMTLGGMVYYWCWLDHEETKLNRRFCLFPNLYASITIPPPTPPPQFD